MKASHAKHLAIKGYYALLVVAIVVLGLFAIGVFGTKPSDVAVIQGEHTIFAPNGSELVSLTVDEEGWATVTYRGVEMHGKFARSSATQDSVTFGLGGMYFCTISNPKYLSFSLEVPPEGFADWPVGTYCMRLKNKRAEPSDGDGGFNELLLNLRDKGAEDAHYEPFVENEPYELFDRVELLDDGSDAQQTGAALLLSKAFLPYSSSKDAMRAASTQLTWRCKGNVVELVSDEVLD